MDDKTAKIYIAGSGGMVGSAIVEELKRKGYKNLLTRGSADLDLINQHDVKKFFNDTKPDIVINAAAKVGGILANDTYRAEFIYNNIMIAANIIQAAYENKVAKLLFLGSSCIYPKLAAQPMKEEELLSGYLEYSNEPYAIAKIAGLKLCENYYKQYGCNFFSVMPTNLYGQNDNFDLQNSHVIPALIRKFSEAQINKSDQVVLWGTGKPKREFLFVDDLAEAVVFVLEKVDAADLYENGISHLNIGTGEDIKIMEAANLIKHIIGFEGEIEYDTSKPDGTPRKLLDVTRINNLGWNYKTSFEEGLRKTYHWYLNNTHRLR